MTSVLRFSEAASLALHAALVLAQEPSRHLTTNEIARRLRVSEAHLAKVLQRLAKAGYVGATRGPLGGYALAKAPEETTLLQIFEAIDGPLEAVNCLLGTPVCSGSCCLLGGLLEGLNRQVRDYLSLTTLAAMAREDTARLKVDDVDRGKAGRSRE